MIFRCFAFSGLAVALSLAASAALHAQSQRFADGVALGDGLLELKVADALRRGDGRWLTLGSRVDADSRETPYLMLRSAGGEQLASVDLAPDDGLSWTARSVVPVDGSNDVIVLGIEYDHRDFSATRGLFIARLGGDLGIVWTRHLRDASLWFDDASLRAREGAAPTNVGTLQHVDGGGQLDTSDAFLADVDVADGSLISPRTLGATEVEERAVDVVADGTDGAALLVQVRRETPSGFESSDGIVGLASDGSLVSTRSIGHALPVGVRAQALRLLRDADSWVLAGRRTSLGANFFYLHRLASDFSPAATRTLIPFFNAMDVAVRDQGVFLYGEANGEVFDRGTVLMHLDADFSIDMQRRYATENLSFPSGAFAFGEGGLLLALGAFREDDGFVYESVARVGTDGVGLFCEEGDYAGFSTGSDAPTEPEAWTPVFAAVDVQTVATAATRRDLVRGDVAVCAGLDEVVFRAGFEEG
jgi:hypothetical protein